MLENAANNALNDAAGCWLLAAAGTVAAAVIPSNPSIIQDLYLSVPGYDYYRVQSTNNNTVGARNISTKEIIWLPLKGPY